MLKYSISITWSDEDKGYVAIIPEFKNLSAFGDTYEEALKEAQLAAEGYIETLKADGMPVPEPLNVSNYSGQIRLRMPRGLHYQLAVGAADQGVSLNSYMVYLLTMKHFLYKGLLALERNMWRRISYEARTSMQSTFGPEEAPRSKDDRDTWVSSTREIGEEAV